ncbi:MAG: hypothetical protein K0S80_5264 [Neobacillus sp.]|jgi:hypothetical protein|nr:hypothetical protein [Neobacillus sp.]
MAEEKFKKINDTYRPLKKALIIIGSVGTITGIVFHFIPYQFNYLTGFIGILIVAIVIIVCLYTDFYINYYISCVKRYNKILTQYNILLANQTEQLSNYNQLKLNRDGLENLIKQKNIELDKADKKIERYRAVEFSRTRYLIAQKNGGIDSVEDTKLVRQFISGEGDNNNE